MRLWISASVLGLGLLLLTPAIVRADITYTYTGSALTTCNGTYAGTCTEETASFTLAAPLGDSMDAENIASIVTAFSISDGSGVTLNLSSPGLFGDLYVETNSTGNISEWSIAAAVCNDVSCSTTTQMITESGIVGAMSVPGFALDFVTTDLPTAPSGPPCITISSFDAAACSLLDTAYTIDTPGNWTVTPEPSSAVLFVSGLIGLIALEFRRRTGQRAKHLRWTKLLSLRW
jgi:hypothetical protein